MPTNRAAWIEEPDSRPLVVREAPYTAPQEGQIVIKNVALAMNPADYKLQVSGSHFSWIKYPTIYGLDISGVVEEVGPGVNSFKKGDCVAAGCGVLAPGNTHAFGAFQLYTVAFANLATHIPDHVSFEEGAVFPLCWFTAAGALFDRTQLALNPPSLTPNPQNKTVVVWGGSSSVGANALQLLRSAGYEVMTTASAKNHAFVKSLGATIAIDHSSPDAKQQILEALKGKVLAGTIDCIGLEGTLESCIQIALEHPNAAKKVASVIPGTEKAGRDGIEVVCVFATANVETEVAGQVWREFMPKALETKAFVPKPDPEIVGHGLEDVQKAIDFLGAGVSAKKLIVTL